MQGAFDSSGPYLYCRECGEFCLVGSSAGLRYLVPFEKVPGEYEATAQFENRMKELSMDVLDQLDVKAKYETNGSYNPDKTDRCWFVMPMEILTRMGRTIPGLRYRLKDLERWSRTYENAYESEESWEQFLHDYVTTVIVCLKQDGSYYYYYGDDFRNKMASGELGFAANGEFVSKEEKLNSILEDGQ